MYKQVFPSVGEMSFLVTKQDVRYAYFLYIVYFVFAIYNVRIVVVQPQCLRGWAFVDEGGRSAEGVESKVVEAAP